VVRGSVEPDAAEALVGRHDTVVAHEIDHVTRAEALEQGQHHLRADAATLVLRQDVDERDIGGEPVVRDRSREANDGAVRSPANDDLVGRAQDLQPVIE